MIKKKRAVCSALVICLLIVMVSFTLGCDYRPKGNTTTWALIKVNGGEPLHVEVLDYTISNGTAYIYTVNRTYITGVNSVLIIKEYKP